MGMAKKSKIIFPLKPMPPILIVPSAATLISAIESVDSSPPASGTGGSIREGPSWIGPGSVDGNTGSLSGFDTLIKWLQDLHLNLASLPLICFGFILYFFPHSSQITIMAGLP